MGMGRPAREGKERRITLGLTPGRFYTGPLRRRNCLTARHSVRPIVAMRDRRAPEPRLTEVIDF
jgi:hypothetical protein